MAVGRVQLIHPKEKVPVASDTLLPLLLHACPDNFNTLTYFEVSSHYVFYKFTTILLLPIITVSEMVNRQH